MSADAPSSAPGPPSWLAPARPVVPDHELVRCIGSGSYGDVWLARNAVGTWRAVKVVFRDRFLDARPYEREFRGIQKFEPLSRGNEAFIDILQIGRNDAAGYFYYVMELADDAGEAPKPEVRSPNEDRKSRAESEPPAPGPRASDLGPRTSALHPDSYTPKTLARVLFQRGRLPVSECLELGLTLNLGLAHLHRAGLIHRDIKPSNIIFVGGVPKLADIGLVIETSEARSFVGTEGYIPPEGPTSPQADLFGLGKVLYEAGMGKDRKDFPEPLTRLAEAPDAARLLEFNAILLKACAANFAERYQSAEEMNADLALLQSGGSVRRQRQLAGQLHLLQRAGAVVTVLAALIASGWWWQVRQTRQVRALAAAEEREHRRAQENLYVADVRLALHDWEAGQVARTLELLDRHVPRGAEPDLRGWEWYYLLSLCHREDRVVRAAPRDVQGLCGHPGSRRLAVAGGDGHIRLLDADSGTVLADLPGHADPAATVAWHPDGVRLASGGRDGRLIVWDTRTLRPVHVLDGEVAVLSVAWSPDGTRLAAGGLGHLERDLDGLVTVWDPASGQRIHRLVGQVGQIRALAWHPSGEFLAAGENFLGRLQLWHSGTGERLRSLAAHRHFIAALAWSPDGRRLASASYDQTIRVWDTDRWEESKIIERPHSGPPTSLAWSPDARWLISAGVDSLVKVWNADTGAVTNVLRGHLGAVRSLAWWPPTAQVVSAGEDGLVRFWHPRREASSTRVAGFGGCAWNPDGRWLATGDAPELPPEQHGAIRILDSFTWEPVDTLPRSGGLAPFCLAWTPDSRLLAVGFGDRVGGGFLEIWDWRQRRRLPDWGPAHEGRQVRSVDWSPNGQELATAGADWTAAVWDARTGSNRLRFREHRATVGTVGWEPAGRLLASRDFDGRVFVWTAEAGRVVASLQLPGTPAVDHPQGLDWSPDGRFLAAGSGDGTVMVYETGGWRVRHALRGHTANVRSVAWSPDGRRLVSGSEDRTIRIWDAVQGRELLVLPALSNRLPGVSWSPAGRAIAIAGGETFIFDAGPGHERAARPILASPVGSE